MHTAVLMVIVQIVSLTLVQGYDLVRENAKNYCETHGGRLHLPRSEKENKDIWDAIVDREPCAYFIDLHLEVGPAESTQRNDVWSTSNGTAIWVGKASNLGGAPVDDAYTNFQDGYPNQTAVKKCATVTGHKVPDDHRNHEYYPNVWRNIDCDYKDCFLYACEKHGPYTDTTTTKHVTKGTKPPKPATYTILESFGNRSILIKNTQAVTPQTDANNMDYNFSHADATKYCKKHGGRLYLPRSQDENTKIWDVIRDTWSYIDSRKCGYFIDLRVDMKRHPMTPDYSLLFPVWATSNGTAIWVGESKATGGAGLGAYTNFAADQPNLNGLQSNGSLEGKDRCVTATDYYKYNSHSKWHNIGCGMQSCWLYACEKDGPFNHTETTTSKVVTTSSSGEATASQVIESTTEGAGDTSLTAAVVLLSMLLLLVV